MKSELLLTGDTHFPYQHPDTFSFLDAVKKKYKPKKVIHLGDLVDNHSISYHEKSPELMSPKDELDYSITMVELLSDIFPKMTILQGNHDKLPIRKARTAGLPNRYIRENTEVFEMPDTWEWKFEENIKMSDGRNLWLRHQFCTNPIDMAISNETCVAQGHYHNQGCMNWVTNSKINVFALTVPCLVDDKSLAMEYNKLDKKRPVLGVVVINKGVPEFVYMKTDENNNWIGEL